MPKSVVSKSKKISPHDLLIENLRNAVRTEGAGNWKEIAAPLLGQLPDKIIANHCKVPPAAVRKFRTQHARAAAPRK